MADFLLEIGTEEVPASVVVPALTQLREGLATMLADQRLGAASVESLGTPRRLTVIAAGLPGRQTDTVRSHRGPARAVAFGGDGAPTRAAEGFARRFGADASALVVRPDGANEYVFYDEQVKGQPAGEVLSQLVPDLLQRLTFPKFMRWGNGNFRFSRPIRWMVALLDTEVVPVEIAGIASGRESWGHRFLPVEEGRAASDPHHLVLASAQDYRTDMAAAHVVVDPEVRAASIREQGERLAAAAGLRVVWDPDLLHEVNYVVEHPTAFLGSFDPKYLALPRPVLVSAMRKHQRYFYLEHDNGSLAPNFLAYRNGGDLGLDLVRHGNERTLAFRFDDAVHHANEDGRHSLVQMRERLRQVVFLGGLGTVWDRSERLAAVLPRLVEAAGVDVSQEDAVLAGELCKADLASNMVAELPELQGVMGQYYGQRDQLPGQVSVAIGEQYQPKSLGDALPGSDLGRLLALADRLDLLAAAFSRGVQPTGSSDPLGLRRAAATSLELLRGLPAQLSLRTAVSAALDALEAQRHQHQVELAETPTALALVLEFFRPRLAAALEADGVPAKLVEALLDAGFDRVPELFARGKFLGERLSDPGSAGVVQAGLRIRNILRPLDDAPLAGDLGRLALPEERELVAAVEGSRSSLHSLPVGAELWAVWAELEAPISRFFDAVMVNDPDPDLKAARHGLLRMLDKSFLRLADFGRIPTTD